VRVVFTPEANGEPDPTVGDTITASEKAIRGKFLPMWIAYDVDGMDIE
jgi:hypothetical protein